MKRNRLKSNKKDKTVRDVEITCVECGKSLKFRTKNEIVIGGEGVIAMNFPCVICHDCINTVLDRVSDPSGLICINNLNPLIAREFLLDFKFLLPYSEAVNFFASLFPESELIDEAATKR
jgi:hypothetical protein